MQLDWDPTQYDYALPEELIAHTPVTPRDSAKLLTYNRKTREIAHHRYTDLPELLMPGSVLVMNDTRVMAARFTVTKKTGGTARVLFLREKKGYWEALADRQLPLGDIVTTEHGKKIEVKEKQGSVYTLKPHDIDTEAFLHTYGTMPLPPYIHSPLNESERRREYQTVIAKHDGSAAAPTASLHFTHDLLTRLEQAGVTIVYVTLHVGLGTFAPLSDEAVTQGTLHHEWYEVSPEAAAVINHAKAEGRPIIAVGTTVIRTLESAAHEGQVIPQTNETDLFIRPGYSFQIVDQIITNFHVPQSSLMQLIATVTGREELLRIYHEAIDNKYRFFSFGDGMLVV